MTGYESKRAMAQDKLEQWGCEAFNNWWDSDYDDSTNPYERDSFAYWAWAGWQAALAHPAQEPVCPECKAGVLYECVACSSNNYPSKPAQEPFGYLSIGGNPIFQKEKPEIGRWETLYTTPPQRTWVEPTGNEWFEWWRVSKVTDATEAEIDFADFLIIAQAVMTKLKEDNK